LILITGSLAMKMNINHDDYPIQNQKGSGGDANWRPVVLMHGLLANTSSMSDAVLWLEETYPGIYTSNIEIGGGKLDSMFIDINTQVDIFTAQIQNDTKLKDGFNLLCHSQGGLICRAYIERINNPPVYNFVSWAGPHDGVYGVPDLNAYCPDYDCALLNWLMDLALDGGWVDQGFQKHFTFASYWKIHSTMTNM